MGGKTRNIYFQLDLQQSCKTSCRFLLPFFRITNFTSWSCRPDSIELRNVPQPTSPFPSFTPSQGIRILLLESGIPLTTAGFCCRFSVSQILRRGRAGRTAQNPTNLPVPSFTPSEGIRILLLESGIRNPTDD